MKERMGADKQTGFVTSDVAVGVDAPEGGMDRAHSAVARRQSSASRAQSKSMKSCSGAAPLRLVISTAPADLVPLMGPRVCAGFPSPADDYVEAALDPAQLIVTNPISTFLWRVAGSSMIGAGINDGDYVVVDRSLKVKSGDVVVAIIDGLPSVKRVRRLQGGRLGLDFDNPSMATLMMDEDGQAEIWGVVTWSLTAHRAPTP